MSNYDDHQKIPARLLHPRWRDMSEWVVHFTPSEANLKSILGEGFIRPSGPYGNGKNIDAVRDKHLSACFSEIPLDILERLYRRRGRWGVGFHKRVIDVAGGGRVWYQERGTPLQQTIFDLFGGLMHEQNFEHAMWSLSPFIDTMSDNYNYRFDWEREWRVPGGLRFSPTDAAFLLVPDESDAIQVASELEFATPAFIANGPVGFATAPEQLGNQRDHQIATFAESFSEPTELLYYDPEGLSGYSWPVPSWETEDAINDIFPDLNQDEKDFLAQELDSISSEWVKLAEWHELGE